MIFNIMSCSVQFLRCTELCKCDSDETFCNNTHSVKHAPDDGTKVTEVNYRYVKGQSVREKNMPLEARDNPKRNFTLYITIYIYIIYIYI